MRLALIIGSAALAFAVQSNAQRPDDRAGFDARMNVLERSVAELSIQIERLKTSDQQLEQQLEKMRSNYDQRLEWLEKGAAPKTAPRRAKP